MRPLILLVSVSVARLAARTEDRWRRELLDLKKEIEDRLKS